MGVCRRSTISRSMGRPAGRSTLPSRTPGSTWRRPGATPSPRTTVSGVNATIPSLGRAAAAEAALQSVESGFLTLKAKAGRGARDRGAGRAGPGHPRRGRAGRPRCGSTSTAPGTSATAIERLEAIARFDIEFVEQPLAAARRRRHGRASPAASASRSPPTRRPRPSATSAACSRPTRWTCSSSSRCASAARAPWRPSPSSPRSGMCAVVISTLFETGIGIAAGAGRGRRVARRGLVALARPARPRAGDGRAPRARPPGRLARHRGWPDPPAVAARLGWARHRPGRAGARAVPRRIHRIDRMTTSGRSCRLAGGFGTGRCRGPGACVAHARSRMGRPAGRGRSWTAGRTRS